MYVDLFDKVSIVGCEVGNAHRTQTAELPRAATYRRQRLYAVHNQKTLKRSTIRRHLVTTCVSLTIQTSDQLRDESSV